jgi:glycosyltransferase involved in cell wall biosynthesis
MSIDSIVLPIVSVIIPAYNYAQYLKKAIDSVLAQTYREYEIIVVNDGSTDNSTEILNEYKGLVYVISQANAGLSAARNSGLNIARGEYIAFLDADDYWYPNALSEMVAYLQKNKRKSLVAGSWCVVDESGAIIKRPQNYNSQIRAEIGFDFYRALTFSDLFPIHALLIKRQCFETAGFFDTELKAMEDWDMWLRIAKCGYKAGLIDTPVACYRIHSGSMSLNIPRMERAFHDVLNKVFSDAYASARLADIKEYLFAFQWLYLAQYCLREKQEPELSRCIHMAAEYFFKSNFKKKINIKFCELASSLLPYTERLLNSVGSLIPDIRPYCLWKITKHLYMSKRREEFLASAIRLIVFHPGWLLNRYIGWCFRMLK